MSDYFITSAIVQPSTCVTGWLAG